MIDYKEIEPHLRGQWAEVLSSYGIVVPPMRGNNSKNMPCPLCGGNDRAHWREEKGRLSLYCRHCAANKMKSPEAVIMEVAGLTFPELAEDLNRFIGGDISTRAPVRVIEKPVEAPENMSARCDKLANDRLGSYQSVDNLPFILREGLAPRGKIYTHNGAAMLPMNNMIGELTNICRFSEDGVDWMAGKPHYGSFWIQRGNDDIAVCASFYDALFLSWGLSSSIYCAIDKYNMAWSLRTLKQLKNCTYYRRGSDGVDIDYLSSTIKIVEMDKL